jgi:hypothetical protein
MKSRSPLNTALIAIFFLFLFCADTFAETSPITLTGDLEIDTSYQTGSLDPDTDTTTYDQGGRIKVSPTARKEAGNLFFEAKADILAKLDGSVAIDDAYGKMGNSIFDVQVGRFEGWSLFDKGVDIIIVDAPNGAGRYEANYARGRMGDAGQVALHVTPNDVFGLEAGLVYGNEGDDNLLGARPVIQTTFGNFEIAAGLDYLSMTPKDDDAESETTKFGYGAKAKAVFGIATLGINYASGTVGGKDADGADIDDVTTASLGGYCDLAVGKGTISLAAFLTNQEEDGSSFENQHTQYFITYAHPLPIDGAVIKIGASQASATQETADGDVDSESLGFKVRLNYTF